MITVVLSSSPTTETGAVGIEGHERMRCFVIIQLHLAFPLKLPCAVCCSTAWTLKPKEYFQLNKMTSEVSVASGSWKFYIRLLQVRQPPPLWSRERWNMFAEQSMSNATAASCSGFIVSLQKSRPNNHYMNKLNQDQFYWNYNTFRGVPGVCRELRMFWDFPVGTINRLGYPIVIIW